MKYNVTELSKGKYFAGFPKFSPDYKFLTYFSVKEDFNSHTTLFELMKISDFDQDWSSFESESVLTAKYSQEGFSGFYGVHDNFNKAHYMIGKENSPNKTLDTTKLVVESTNNGKATVVIVDVEEGSLEVKEDASLFKVDNGYPIIERSSYK